MRVAEVPVGHQHFEFGIKSQECLQQVLFGPKTRFFYYPIAPVFKRQENVMAVYDDYRMEAWQNFEEQIIDVSAGFHRVRTVDKEYVIGAKLGEEFEINILYRLFDERTQTSEPFPKKVPRKWIHADEI
jgi:hypothetical protein